jgi:hypothetical protein
MTAAGRTTARVAGAPALLRYRESPDAAAGHGTVLFYQAAEFDEHCPPGPIRAFYAALEPCYAAEPARIESVEYPAVRHALTPELDAESCERTVAWFQRWLP